MYNPESYIFAESAERYLTAEEIEELCYWAKTRGDDVKDILRKAINEIYARKGYDFTGTQYYESYLKSKIWYRPMSGKIVTENELNVYEKSNIDLLVWYEKQIGESDK